MNTTSHPTRPSAWHLLVLAGLMLLAACDSKETENVTIVPPNKPEAAKKAGEEGASKKKTAVDPAAAAANAVVDKATEKAEAAPKAAEEAPKAPATGEEKAAEKTTELGGEAPKAANVIEGGEITFARKVPAIGAVTTETTNTDMSLKMRLMMLGMPKDLSSLEKSSDERVVTVLGTSKEAVTKVKVAYKTKRKEGTENGKPKPAVDSAVTGKTFTVEVTKEGALKCLDAAGQPAGPKETRVLQADFVSLGKVDQFALLLPAKPMKAGDKIDLSQAAVKELMKVGEEPMEFSDFTFTLKEVRQEKVGKVGVFSLTLKIAVKPGPGMSINMDVKGEVVLSAEGWLWSFTLEGPIKVSVDEQFKEKMEVSGSGNIKIAKKVDY